MTKNILTYNKIGASVLRFLIGFLLFKDFLIYFINRSFLFDNKGIVSYNTYLDIVNYYKLGWLYIDFLNQINVNIFCCLGVLFSFLFMIGIFQKISAVILFFLLFVFKIRNLYLLDGADNVILVLLPFFLFINTYSFSQKYNFLKNKYFVNKNNAVVNLFSKYFLTAITIQLCIVYFFSGLHKLQGGVWRDGTALYYILNSDDFSPTKFNYFFTNYLWLVKLCSWTTIVFQLTFPIFIFIKQTKIWTIMIGVLLHIGIFFMMKIDNFSLLMISCYAIFFNDNQYKLLLTNLKIKNYV